MVKITVNTVDDRELRDPIWHGSRKPISFSRFTGLPIYAEDEIDNEDVRQVARESFLDVRSFADDHEVARKFPELSYILPADLVSAVDNYPLPLKYEINFGYKEEADDFLKRICKAGKIDGEAPEAVYEDDHHGYVVKIDLGKATSKKDAEKRVKDFCSNVKKFEPKKDSVSAGTDPEEVAKKSLKERRQRDTKKDVREKYDNNGFVTNLGKQAAHGFGIVPAIVGGVGYALGQAHNNLGLHYVPVFGSLLGSVARTCLGYGAEGMRQGGLLQNMRDNDSTVVKAFKDVSHEVGQKTAERNKNWFYNGSNILTGVIGAATFVAGTAVKAVGSVFNAIGDGAQTLLDKFPSNTAKALAFPVTIPLAAVSLASKTVASVCQSVSNACLKFSDNLPFFRKPVKAVSNFFNKLRFGNESKSASRVGDASSITSSRAYQEGPAATCVIVRNGKMTERGELFAVEDYHASFASVAPSNVDSAVDDMFRNALGAVMVFEGEDRNTTPRDRCAEVILNLMSTQKGVKFDQTWSSDNVTIPGNRPEGRYAVIADHVKFTHPTTGKKRDLKVMMDPSGQLRIIDNKDRDNGMIDCDPVSHEDNIFTDDASSKEFLKVVLTKIKEDRALKSYQDSDAVTLADFSDLCKTSCPPTVKGSDVIGPLEVLKALKEIKGASVPFEIRYCDGADHEVFYNADNPPSRICLGNEDLGSGIYTAQTLALDPNILNILQKCNARDLEEVKSRITTPAQEEIKRRGPEAEAVIGRGGISGARAYRVDGRGHRESGIVILNK